MIRSRQTLALLAPVLALAALAGCGPGYIKGTKIRNTPDNRAIIDVLRAYQKAMEARSADAILALCAPTYHESLGTFGGEDDYGYDKLPARLRERFSRLRSLTYRVTVKKIEVEGGGSRAAVFYTYDMQYQFTVDGTERWSTESADHRMLLEKSGDGGWRIVSGL